jgi:hypothetical protein
MAPASFYLQALPLLSGLVLAADYPGIPKDLTTPVQQRIAFKGPNGMFESSSDSWNDTMLIQLKPSLLAGTPTRNCSKAAFSMASLQLA